MTLPDERQIQARARFRMVQFILAGLLVLSLGLAWWWVATHS